MERASFMAGTMASPVSASNLEAVAAPLASLA
jgi:hypothetical protein